MVNQYLILIFIIINLSVLRILISSEGTTFSYNYHLGTSNGPDHWYEFSPQCSGNNQSPIDIDTNLVRSNNNMRYLQFDRNTNDPIQYVMKNIGSTIDIEAKGLVQNIFGGGLSNTYTFTKLHFHWAKDAAIGSEHSVNGYHYPLEIHFVHYNSDKYENITEALKFSDGLAVLGVFVEIKDSNNPQERLSSGFTTITENIHHIFNKGEHFDLPQICLGSLFPAHKDFYRYSGSLTTPPCSESVAWTVFRNPIYATEEQMEEIKKVQLGFYDFETNSRPTTQLNGRTVYSCCDKGVEKNAHRKNAHGKNAHGKNTLGKKHSHKKYYGKLNV